MCEKLKYIIVILIFFQILAISFAFAQEEGSSANDLTSAAYEENLKRWQNMSEEQREVIRQKVQAIDSQQRETMQENARKFRKLPPEEQNRIQGNFQKFKKLPNEKKEFLRERSRRFQMFSLEERTQLRRRVREKTGREDIRGREEDYRDRQEDAGERGESIRERREERRDLVPGQDKVMRNGGRKQGPRPERRVKPGQGPVSKEMGLKAGEGLAEGNGREKKGLRKGNGPRNKVPGVRRGGSRK
ncbi:MAG: DUF3106 domain-containing protein [Candidatus Omnitrophica bacterium]|nr:DUF3106 domain-containing protein [Candidatus Omnitrophota bacterium]